MKNVPAVTSVQPEIRPFPIGSILAEVEEALDGLSPEAHGAVIAYADGQQGGLAVVGRIGSKWSYVGRVDKPWKGKLEAHAEVRFQW